jgi:hypothetical protein
MQALKMSECTNATQSHTVSTHLQGPCKRMSDAPCVHVFDDLVPETLPSVPEPLPL